MQEITEDYLIGTVLSNGEILQHFPFLLQVKKLSDEIKTCPPCKSATKGQELSKQIQVAKRHLAKMGQSDKDLFKQLLKLSDVRVFYPEQVDGKYIRQRIDF